MELRRFAHRHPQATPPSEGISLAVGHDTQNEQQAERQRHRTASDADRKAKDGPPVADGGRTGPDSLTSLEHAS
jgi:hypothetical protein